MDERIVEPTGCSLSSAILLSSSLESLVQTLNLWHGNIIHHRAITRYAAHCRELFSGVKTNGRDSLIFQARFSRQDFSDNYASSTVKGYKSIDPRSKIRGLFISTNLSLMWASYAATIHRVGGFEIGFVGGCLSPRPNDLYFSTKTISQSNHGHTYPRQKCNLQQSHATDSTREALIGRENLKSTANLTSAHTHRDSHRTQ